MPLPLRNADPVNADDIAAYVLSRLSEMTTWKLQKLLYYAQAWSLVWDEEPLFSERIEAWANGPVIPALYRRHRGRFKVGSWPEGHAAKLDERQRATVDAVIDFYGPRSSQWLSDLTHMEDPWREARVGLAPGERGDREVTLDSLAQYYGGLEPDGQEEGSPAASRQVPAVGR